MDDHGWGTWDSDGGHGGDPLDGGDEFAADLGDDGRDPLGQLPGADPAGDDGLADLTTHDLGLGDDGEHADTGLPADDHGVPEEPLALDAADPEPHGDDPGDPGGAHPGPEDSDDDRPEPDHTPDGHPDTAGEAEPLVGADPDAPVHGEDTAWADPQFPPALEFSDPPEPVDGFPWSDPATLGDPAPDSHPDEQAAWPSPPADDLAAYAGSDPAASAEQTWADLLAAEDPATSSLARWWAPGG